MATLCAVFRILSKNLKQLQIKASGYFEEAHALYTLHSACVCIAGIYISSTPSQKKHYSFGEKYFKQNINIKKNNVVFKTQISASLGLVLHVCFQDMSDSERNHHDIFLTLTQLF